MQTRHFLSATIIMVNKNINGRESAVNYAKRLMLQKEGIQAEMEANFSVLSANESTMNSPLVDSEGFPRADIDVYAVRHARVRIIELRNDMKAIIDNISEALAAVHSAAKAEDAAEKESAMDTSGGEDAAELLVFARVDAVMPGSPAAAAVSPTSAFSDVSNDNILLGIDARGSSLAVR